MAMFNFTSNPNRQSSIPDVEEPTKRVLDFCHSLAEEGKSFIRAQEGYEHIEETMRRIMGPDEPLRSRNLSTISDNEFAKIASVIAASVTDIKPYWDFRSENPDYEQAAMIGNHLSTHWYFSNNIDRKLEAVAKFCMAAASGYAHVIWNPHIKGHGDIEVIAEDPRDVYPIRPPKGALSMQEAMGCIVHKELTPAHIEAMFRLPPGTVKKDRDGSHNAIFNQNTRTGKILNKINVSPREIYKMITGGPAAKSEGPAPAADLYYFYFDDPTINEGPPREVGDFITREGRRIPANHWSYVADSGQPLYPNKRMIIFTSQLVLYDGPSIYWHGMIPVVKMTLDPWPWTWLGKSVMWDLLPLQSSLDRHMRYMEDKIAVLLRPPVAGEITAVSRAELNRFDLAQPGQKLRFKGMMNKDGIRVLEIPGIDASVPLHIDRLITRMQHLGGTADISQLLAVNQIPSGETIDKLQFALSPELRGKSRAMESFMREFASILMYNFAEFYTYKRRLKILGSNGMTFEDFDFDPGNFIPAPLHSRDLPRFDRAREMMRHMTFHIKPGSMLESSHTTRRLLYLQLARMGYIDIWTLNRELDIPNMGPEPQGSIPDRLQKQAEMQIGMSVGPAGASAAGRKATAQANPTMRGDGRISESGA